MFKGSLGNSELFFYCIAMNPPFETFIFKSVQYMFSPSCSISSMERRISGQNTTSPLRFWIRLIRPPLKKSYPNSTARTTMLRSRRPSLSSSRSGIKWWNPSVLQRDSRQSFLIGQISVIDWNKHRLLQSVFPQILLTTARSKVVLGTWLYSFTDINCLFFFHEIRTVKSIIVNKLTYFDCALFLFLIAVVVVCLWLDLSHHFSVM